MTAKDDPNARRLPKQARSRATWEAIVEAAAQILEWRGADAFNTNAVAERAGVSIGTLYQYFADKQALLVAVVRRELEAEAGVSVAMNRRSALIEALIAALERLAGFGGAAGAGTTAHTPTRSPRTRRGTGVEQRTAELLQDWLVALIPAPRPTLIPLQIRRTEPRR
jgi:AcrR family transcriptional regulator